MICRQLANQCPILLRMSFSVVAPSLKCLQEVRSHGSDTRGTAACKWRINTIGSLQQCTSAPCGRALLYWRRYLNEARTRGANYKLSVVVRTAVCLNSSLCKLLHSGTSTSLFLCRPGTRYRTYSLLRGAIVNRTKYC